ncbi:hypothetical protein L596_023263 [Steinernema carpocapsae]|uniref:Fatty-acid and retinol-binding protein 1 n=1 Tax=Steinernema carpocapsae TaxID=34508 RepID=A0A4U5MDX3_STECR|nr:hypothetical protein L596_023263 [Steinernema carpocapsae]
MFFRFAVPVFLLAVAASAFPVFDVNKIPAEIKGEASEASQYSPNSESISEVIPVEVRDFYKSLTAEDKAVLKELAAKAKDFTTEEQAIEALKEKSESLYTRAKAIYDVVHAKVEALDTEAKTFVRSNIAIVREFRAEGKVPTVQQIKQFAKDVIAKYIALSPEAKVDLQTQFPQITKFAKNEKVRKIAEGLLKEQN